MSLLRDAEGMATPDDFTFIEDEQLDLMAREWDRYRQTYGLVEKAEADAILPKGEFPAIHHPGFGFTA